MSKTYMFKNCDKKIPLSLGTVLLYLENHIPQDEFYAWVFNNGFMTSSTIAKSFQKYYSFEDFLKSKKRIFLEEKIPLYFDIIEIED